MDGRMDVGMDVWTDGRTDDVKVSRTGLQDSNARVLAF